MGSIRAATTTTPSAGASLLKGGGPATATRLATSPMAHRLTDRRRARQRGNEAGHLRSRRLGLRRLASVAGLFGRPLRPRQVHRTSSDDGRVRPEPRPISTAKVARAADLQRPLQDRDERLATFRALHRHRPRDRHRSSPHRRLGGTAGCRPVVADQSGRSAARLRRRVTRALARDGAACSRVGAPVRGDLAIQTSTPIVSGLPWRHGIAAAHSKSQTRAE